MKLASDFLFALVVTTVLTASPAQAYLDGATISLFLQAVAGTVAGALLFGKAYLSRITGFFRRSPDAAGKDEQQG
jgi:hypothetical protein